MVGQLAALILLAGCASAAAPNAVAARTDFARERYCPLRRVFAAAIDVTPPPRAAIARDPERLAMWRRRARSREAGTRWIGVAGCEEHALYLCRNVAVRETLGRHGRTAFNEPICLEQGMSLPETEASTRAP